MRPAPAEAVAEHHAAEQRVQLQAAVVPLAAIRLDLGVDVDPAQVERGEPVPVEHEVEPGRRRRPDRAAEVQVVRVLVEELGEVDARAEVRPPAAVRVEVIERAEGGRQQVRLRLTRALDLDVVPEGARTEEFEGPVLVEHVADGEDEAEGIVDLDVELAGAKVHGSDAVLRHQVAGAALHDPGLLRGRCCSGGEHSRCQQCEKRCLPHDGSLQRSGAAPRCAPAESPAFGEFTTGAGPVAMQVPAVEDRSADRFSGAGHPQSWWWWPPGPCTWPCSSSSPVASRTSATSTSKVSTSPASG